MATPSKRGWPHKATPSSQEGPRGVVTPNKTRGGCMQPRGGSWTPNEVAALPPDVFFFFFFSGHPYFLLLFLLYFENTSQSFSLLETLTTFQKANQTIFLLWMPQTTLFKWELYQKHLSTFYQSKNSFQIKTQKPFSKHSPNITFPRNYFF